jgi:GNAT superfamily N-acetyltransferase
MLKQRKLTELNDRRGLTYEVWTPEHEDLPHIERLNVRLEGKQVAYVNLGRGQADYLHLLDIHIEETVQLPPRSWHERAKHLLGRPRELPLRRNGLGSVLLRYVITIARGWGYREIRGEISPNDDCLELRRWYQDHGFDIVLAEQGRWTALISKKF